MKKGNIFYILFILTILAVRLGVFLFPAKKIIINGTLIHHFWVGIILVFLVLLFSKSYNGIRMGVFAVGMGLIADELVYMIMGGGTVAQYWSTYSIVGAIVVVVVIFMLRSKLVRGI